MKAGLRKILMAILDIVIINISLYLSLTLRFENDIPMQYFTLFKETHVVVTVIALCSFLKHPDLKMRPTVLIDDDVDKYGMRIHGVRVFGGRELIPEMVQRKNIKEIVIAMPSIDRLQIRDCEYRSETKCKLRILLQ